MFDPHAFIKAMGIAVAIIAQASAVAATIAQTSATVGDECPKNSLQTRDLARFRSVSYICDFVFITFLIFSMYWVL